MSVARQPETGQIVPGGGLSEHAHKDVPEGVLVVKCPACQHGIHVRYRQRSAEHAVDGATVQ